MIGKQVTMFLTFWRLNILRRDRQPTTGKGILDKMCGWMMPLHLAARGDPLIRDES